MGRRRDLAPLRVAVLAIPVIGNQQILDRRAAAEQEERSRPNLSGSRIKN